MNPYQRVKELLLELHGASGLRKNHSALGAISAKHARNAMQHKQYYDKDGSKTPDHKLARKYGDKARKLVGEPIPPPRGGRVGGSKKGYHGT